MHRALLVIDFINATVDPKGTLSRKGYTKFIAEHGTFEHLNTAIGAFRKAGDPVIFLRPATDPADENKPRVSSDQAQSGDTTVDDTWPTQICDAVDYREGDETIVQKYGQAFAATGLVAKLRHMDITDVYIAGVDSAVEFTARAATDHKFNAYVVTDAYAEAKKYGYDRSLTVMSGFAQLVTAAEL